MTVDRIEIIKWHADNHPTGWLSAEYNRITERLYIGGLMFTRTVGQYKSELEMGRSAICQLVFWQNKGVKTSLTSKKPAWADQ